MSGDPGFQPDEDACESITLEDCARFMRYAVDMIAAGYPGETMLEIDRFAGWLETELKLEDCVPQELRMAQMGRRP